MDINCDDCKLCASCKTRISNGSIKSCGKFKSKSSLSLAKKTTFSKTKGKASPNNYFQKFGKNNDRSISIEKKARIAKIRGIAKKILTNAKEANEIDNHQKNDYDWQKRKILKDVEIGRGGPDIAGLKKMNRVHDSKIIADAKKKMLR